MILNIVVLLLIIATTFMNSIFGLYSGLINVICTIAAAATAFGFFEPLTQWATGSLGLHPSYAPPAALMVLFIVTGVVLRTAADQLLRGNVRIPMYVDWAGGAICGFVIAQVAIGTLVIGFLMLPFGGRAAMYSRITRTDEKDRDGRVQFARHAVWLGPDAFTVGLVNTLSSGSLSGNVALNEVYPDLPLWVFWTGNTVQPESLTAPERGQRGDGNKDIRVTRAFWHSGGIEARYLDVIPTKLEPEPAYKNQTFSPAAGMKLLGVKLELGMRSADGGKFEVYHRFRPSMLRVVGTRASGEPRDYIARVIGGADPKIGEAARIADIDNNFAVKPPEEGDGQTRLDVYFEVDDDFTPKFVEYRRFARAPLEIEAPGKAPPAAAAPKREQPKAAAAPRPPTPPETPTPPDLEGQRVGRTGFIGALESPSGDANDLPFSMDAARLQAALDVQVDGGKLVWGRLSGRKADLESKGDNRVQEFKVPEGQRLCQIRFKPYVAQGVAGQVFNFIGRTTNQYVALDKQSNEYPLVGYFAVVKRGGDEYVELFFTGGTGSEWEPAAAYNGMLDFKEIRGPELKDQQDAVVGLLFFVPPGETIHRIQNQAGHGIEGLDFKMGG